MWDYWSKVVLRLVAVAIMVAAAYKGNRFANRTMVTIQTYGKLGNESRELVAQERGFLNKALPDTVGNINIQITKLGDAAVHLQQTADGLTSLARELQGTSAQATQTLATAQTGMAGIALAAQDTIKATQPTITAVGGAVGSVQQAATDLDRIATSARLQATLTSVQGIAANLDATTAQGTVVVTNVRKISDKVTTNFLHPTPWYGKTWNYLYRGGQLYWDFTR